MRLFTLLALLLAALCLVAVSAHGDALTVSEFDGESAESAIFVESEAEAEMDAEADVEADTETEAEADAETEVEADADAEAEVGEDGVATTACGKKITWERKEEANPDAALMETEAEMETEVDVSALPRPGAKCGAGSRGTCTAQARWCSSSTVAQPNLCAGTNGVGAGVCCFPKAGAPVPQVSAPAASTAFGTTAVQRAGTWVSAKLRYCQAANGGRDQSSSCPKICKRQSNPAWDRYRSDCSGLVSFAWGLPAPGETTSTLKNVARQINCADLRAGDAINRAGSHTMLFVRWIVAGKQAQFYEEPGCAMAEPWARSYTADLTCSGVNVNTVKRGKFVAMRKNGQ